MDMLLMIVVLLIVTLFIAVYVLYSRFEEQSNAVSSLKVSQLLQNIDDLVTTLNDIDTAVHTDSSF